MSTRSWRQIVLDADPDWQRLSRRPWVYEFSNGRRFYQPDDPYNTGALPQNVLTDEGDPLTDEGEFLTDDAP